MFWPPKANAKLYTWTFEPRCLPLFKGYQKQKHNKKKWR